MDEKTGVVVATVPGSQGLVHPRLSAVRSRAFRTTSGSMSGCEEFRQFEQTGDLPQLIDHPPGQRSHGRHAPGHAHATRDGRGERPRARPDRRSHLAQPLLERIGHLRARRRRAERTRSRGRASFAGARHQPVLETAGGRQHALYDLVGAADDGADPRPRADEPVPTRRRRRCTARSSRRRTRRRFTRFPRGCRSTSRTRSPRTGRRRRCG